VSWQANGRSERRGTLLVGYSLKCRNSRFSHECEPKREENGSYLGDTEPENENGKSSFKSQDMVCKAYFSVWEASLALSLCSTTTKDSS